MSGEWSSCAENVDAATMVLQASGGSEDHHRLVKEEEPDSSTSPDMTVAESRKISFTHQPQFLHVPAYAIDQTAASRGVPFVALATQDFLQPLERGSTRENHMTGALMQPCCPGDIPLQLSSRSERDPGSDHMANVKESRMHVQNLRMQYGYIDNTLVPKTGVEQSQQSVTTNRNWQQGVLNTNVSNKRPRSAQSEGDETDVDERRKVTPREGTSRDDANSRSVDIKASTSRSKHSATEQRRRSKINDRFQMLRDLLPHGDQKRDKASFLLEVIEYIQTLQDKVKRYETVEKGRHGNKAITWESPSMSTSLKETSAAGAASNREKPSFGPVMQGRSFGPAPSPRLQSSLLNNTPTHAQRSRQSQAPPVVEDLTRESSPMKANASASTASPVETRNDEGTIGRPAPPAEARESVKNGQQKLHVKQGTISLSTAYSQGLLETLTSALQTSGLDLSKANISVQIELGKTPETKGNASDTSLQ